MRRAAGLLFGLGTHLLFAFTVWHLVRFLAGFTTAVPGESVAGGLALDGVLALQFGLFHSLLLHPAVRERLGNWIAGPFYGGFYCAATCVSLLGVILAWRASPLVVWEFTGHAAWVVRGAFVCAWGALVHSLHLTGLGWQTGLTPWWAWVRGRPAPRREFRPRSSYLVLRHPVYLSFLGLVWLTPVVTLDRALLIAVWTAYIFVGSWLKDRRLEHYLGETYREYASRVAGYPFFPAGPLARRPRRPTGPPTDEVPEHAPRHRLSYPLPTRVEPHGNGQSRRAA